MDPEIILAEEQIGVGARMRDQAASRLTVCVVDDRPPTLPVTAQYNV